MKNSYVGLAPHFFLTLLFSLALAGCASKDTLTPNEDQLYSKAQTYLDKKNYLLAIENLEQIEDLYPFGQYGLQAQLELIYAYYESGSQDVAVTIADRFIRLNPDHPQVDYAWYMRGLGYYKLSLKGSNILSGTRTEARDPTLARKAFDYFNDFLVRFPDSEFATDARFRMYQIRDRLAQHHLVVAQYYVEREAWVAAANRAIKVVKEFDGTPAVGDALALLITSYQKMDLNDLSDSALVLLKSNFPDHSSLQSGQFQPIR